VKTKKKVILPLPLLPLPLLPLPLLPLPLPRRYFVAPVRLLILPDQHARSLDEVLFRI